MVDDKKNIPDVKKVEILQAGKRREANPDPRHGRSYPCWKGGGFYCSQGWPRNGEVYEETVSDEGLTNEDILDHDNRGRKIFCVYGKNSSLIRNRYV